MYGNQCLKLVQPKEPMDDVMPKIYNAYDSRQVTNIIKRYQELRSVVEIVATKHDRMRQGGPSTGKEEILCALVDIDQAMGQLTPRQRVVIRMLKEGYPYEDICAKLGVCVATIKFHARQGIFRLTAYLNS